MRSVPFGIDHLLRPTNLNERVSLLESTGSPPELHPNGGLGSCTRRMSRVHVCDYTNMCPMPNIQASRFDYNNKHRILIASLATFQQTMHRTTPQIVSCSPPHTPAHLASIVKRTPSQYLILRHVLRWMRQNDAVWAVIWEGEPGFRPLCGHTRYPCDHECVITP